MMLLSKSTVLCPGSLLSFSAGTDRPTQTYQVLREQTEWSRRLNSDSNVAFFSCRQNSPMVIYDLQKGRITVALISSVKYVCYSKVKDREGHRQ